jgi:hypothetical protein
MIFAVCLAYLAGVIHLLTTPAHVDRRHSQLMAGAAALLLMIEWRAW